jgi:peptidoglycan/xylan/chitin deacetylase (PgdA/CDA1 family)
MHEPVVQPWQWSETTWRGHVDAVRAGRRLVPPRWPGDARVAVALSFDSDHETIPLRDGETRPGRLSQGEYGARVAVPRILGLLEDREIVASFFVPAVSALLHPDDIAAYVDGGHDAPYFTMDRFTGSRPYTPPRGAFEIWRAEFDEAYAGGGLFQLTLHPHVIGHRSRLVVLRELLDHIRGHDGVWFGTHADVAALARAELSSARTAAN